MPLTAVVKTTGERIIIQEDLASAKAHKDDLICPICDQPVVPVRDFLRQGAIVQAYARHRDARDHAETTYRYHTESREHMNAKAHLAANVGALLDIPVAAHEFEVRLPEVMRIADVRLQLKSGDYLIVEAQLSPTTPEELEERTNDYEQLGYTVCWALGKEAYKDYNYRWCIARTGVCLVLNFRYDDVSDHAPRRAA